MNRMLRAVLVAACLSLSLVVALAGSAGATAKAPTQANHPKIAGVSNAPANHTCVATEAKPVALTGSTSYVGDRSVQVGAQFNEKGWHNPAGDFFGCGKYQVVGVYRSNTGGHEYITHAESFIEDVTTSTQVPGTYDSWSGTQDIGVGGWNYWYGYNGNNVNLNCSTDTYWAVFSVTESGGDADWSYARTVNLIPECITP